jgi:hypothetical protein
MVAVAFWAFEINRMRDTWVSTELNRLGRKTLPRIPSSGKRRCQRASLSSGTATAARLQEDDTGTGRVTAPALHSAWPSGRVGSTLQRQGGSIQDLSWIYPACPANVSNARFSSKWPYQRKRHLRTSPAERSCADVLISEVASLQSPFGFGHSTESFEP